MNVHAGARLSSEREIVTLRRLIEEKDLEIATLTERVRDLEKLFKPSALLPPEWRLTAKEADLFCVLLNGTAVVTKDSAYRALYPDYHVEPKVLDVFICKIRKKLQPYQIRIATVWGRGWYLVDRGRLRQRILGTTEPSEPGAMNDTAWPRPVYDRRSRVLNALAGSDGRRHWFLMGDLVAARILGRRDEETLPSLHKDGLIEVQMHRRAVRITDAGIVALERHKDVPCPARLDAAE